MASPLKFSQKRKFTEIGSVIQTATLKTRLLVRTTLQSLTITKCQFLDIKQDNYTHRAQTYALFLESP